MLLKFIQKCAESESCRSWQSVSLEKASQSKGVGRTNSNPKAMLHTAELENAIQHIDCNFREAFDLYNQGFQYKEIAEKLGITIGTVKSRIFYVRKKLMAGLAEYQLN